MGFFKKVKNLYTNPWDTSRMGCQYISCNSPHKKCSWICSNCLDMYCDSHRGEVYMYSPDDGVSSMFLASRENRHQTEKRVQEFNATLMLEWFSGLCKKVDLKSHISGWGPKIKYMDRGSAKEGFIFCERCKNKIKNADMHKEIISLRKIPELEHNWLWLKMDDGFRSRLIKKYG